MKSSNSGKLPVMVVAIVLVVVLLAGMGVFVMKSRGTKSSHKKEKGPVAQMALGEFVVNLADAQDIRYLKANVVLEVAGEVKGGGGHGESGPDPKIRDAVIEVASSKTFAELAKPGGKEHLKKDIIATVNKRLEHSEVVEVYFNEFAMQ